MKNKTQAKELLQEVRSNHEKLSSCAMHNFDERPVGMLNYRHTCSNCGGQAYSDAVVWYNRGVSHTKAQLNANKL